MAKEDEIRVKELMEKLRVDEITPKEAFRELQNRGLLEQERWEIIPWVLYFILWLPLNFTFSGQLSAIRFPPIIIYVSLGFLALGTYFAAWVMYSHRKRGGLLKADETITFYKTGLYRIMRHPGALGGVLWPILLPIILSAHVPFTILSAAAIIVMIVYLYIGVILEEKISIRKWGTVYSEYMAEVPRFNFIVGLWNLRKEKEEKDL
ncbi:MAG: hypothetical protein JW878_03185 [Methanomicrobia archaeon]|nr:hypothetical protein [Methanomicrobia archaeon]